MDAIYSLRISQSRRATAWRDGDFMRMLTVVPDQDSTYGRKLRALVILDKPGLTGRDAQLAARGQPLRKKLVTLVFDDPMVYAWGGERLSLPGQAMGDLSSVGWGWAAERCVALGYLRGVTAAVRSPGLHRTPTVSIARRRPARAGLARPRPPTPTRFTTSVSAPSRPLCTALCSSPGCTEPA